MFQKATRAQAQSPPQKSLTWVPSKCDASIFGHVSDNVEALLLRGFALTSTALQRKAKCVTILCM